MFDLRTLMSNKVVSAHRGNTIHRAAKLLVESDQVFLPIIDDSNKLVGVVTEKMLIKWYANAKNSSEPISSCMKTNVMSFELNSGLMVLVYRFIRDDLREIPITLNGRLAGIVKRGSIIRHIMGLKEKMKASV